MTGDSFAAADQEWLTWLGTLADAARDFERRLDAGETAAFPDLPRLPGQDGQLPGQLPSQLPGHLLEPARVLLHSLQALSRRAEAEREVLRGRLQVLAVPRPRHRTVASHDLGGALDVSS